MVAHQDPQRKQPPAWSASGPPPTPPRCPTCGRSTAPWTQRRSALLDVLTLITDVAREAHDPDERHLLMALAQDAKAAAEEVAL